MLILKKRRNKMKKMITVITMVCLVASLQLFAQPQGRPDRSQQQEVVELTDTQVEQITTILADYDPETFTADDAKAIQEAFREKKLRGGKEIDEVIEKAGFDPKKLSELASPPEREEGDVKGENGRERKDRSQNAPRR
jgi:hypothetical protein